MGHVTEAEVIAAILAAPGRRIRAQARETNLPHRVSTTTRYGLVRSGAVKEILVPTLEVVPWIGLPNDPGTGLTEDETYSITSEQIAALPQLLEAVRNFLEISDGVECTWWEKQHLLHLEQAVAKAEGRL